MLFVYSLKYVKCSKNLNSPVACWFGCFITQSEDFIHFCFPQWAHIGNFCSAY